MFNLFVGVFKRSFTEMKRYYVNYLSTIITMFIIYTLIILGVKSIGGPSAGDTLQATAIGYLTWIAVLMTLTDLSWTIMNEMQRGIIEQEFLSPYGPLAVFIFYEISNLILNVPIMIGMMYGMFAVAGISLEINPLFFILLILLMAQSQGIGFILGGLTLKLKRTNALLQLIQFAVIGLLFVKTEGLQKVFIPISPYFELLRKVFNATPIQSYEVFFTIIGTFFWLFIGIVIFNFFEKVVRKEGALSIY